MDAYNIIRIVVVLISGLSIFFGYRLFYLVTERQGKLKIEDKDTSITLSDVGPGVFFAFFGTITLVSVLVTQPYIETTITKPNDSEEIKKPGSIQDTVINIRAPASSNQDVNEFELFCIVDSRRSGFDEGVKMFESIKWFHKNEPYESIKETDKEKMISLLGKLGAPPAFMSLAKSTTKYSDYYYLLKSFLLYYYSSSRC